MTFYTTEQNVRTATVNLILSNFFHLVFCINVIYYNLRQNIKFSLTFYSEHEISSKLARKKQVEGLATTQISPYPF